MTRTAPGKIVLMRNGPYELVLAPPEYPGKRYRGRYCYEHHLVWWQHTGELCGPDEEVHHKDENKRRNVFSNLEKMTKKEHRDHHIAERKKAHVIQHGGYCAYKRHKCRCAECLVWWAAFKVKVAPVRRAWRAARRVQKAEPAPTIKKLPPGVVLRRP